MRATLFVLGSLLLVSCSGRGPATTQENSEYHAQVPAQITFEKDISGRILAYDLQHPAGVALDALGNLYVSDSDNHRLIKFDRDLNAIRDYGGYGGGPGKFLNPEDIIVDRGLHLYVLDTGNRRVVHLDVKLNFVDEIFPEDDSLEIISNRGKLSGLQISSLGEITVADYDNSRLIRMDNFNRFSRYVGDFGYGRGALMQPVDIGTGKDDLSYVADAGNGRIAVYDDYGNYLREIGNGILERPSALTVSPYGTVWVADGELNSLFAFSPDGNLLYQIADINFARMSFSDIEAITVSPDRKLYLADSGSNRILIFSIAYEAGS